MHLVALASSTFLDEKIAALDGLSRPKELKNHEDALIRVAEIPAFRVASAQRMIAKSV